MATIEKTVRTHRIDTSGKKIIIAANFVSRLNRGDKSAQRELKRLRSIYYGFSFEFAERDTKKATEKANRTTLKDIERPLTANNRLDLWEELHHMRKATYVNTETGEVCRYAFSVIRKRFGEMCKEHGIVFTPPPTPPQKPETSVINFETQEATEEKKTA